MPIELDSLLSKAQFRATEVAARAGEYQLFLGAGASVGAIGHSGPLPLSSDLVRVLKRCYPTAPISESDTLPRAYQRSVIVSSSEHVYSTLRSIFSDCSHEAWFRDLADFPWRRVWTLNIDDAFQNEYAKTLRSDSQSCRTITWDEPYSESGELEIVHLHGHVHTPEPRRLVFSFSEYQSAARERPVWDQVLGGVLVTRPIVALGARLLDDPDVENLFLNCRPTAAAPSIVVDPYISEGNEFELRRAGFHVLRCPGSEFVDAWRRELSFTPESLALLHSKTTVDIPQLIRLQTNHVPPTPRSHDYFAGDEPLWADSCAKRPAFFGWMSECVAEIEEWLHGDSRPTVVKLLYARRLSGGTSGLLVIAREARRLAVEVVQFDKSSRLNVERFLDFCQDAGPVLLIADGAAEFGDDIDKIAKRADERNGVELYILVAERPGNDLRIEGRLQGNYRKVAQKVPRTLDRRDSRALVNKLEEFGRLGSLELESERARVAHFEKRDVFSGLADVEYAIGFRKRLEGEIVGLDSEWKWNVVLLLAFASLGGVEVGVMEASLAVGLASDKIVGAVRGDEHLSALVEMVDDRLVARQRDRAIEAIVRIRGRRRSLDAVLEMVKGIAPLATRQGLRERNRPAVLVGRLMNAKQLRSTFPSEDIDRFFEELRETFGDWNGRYWEQRAIHAKSLGDWARAESFAARAVQLYDDAFTRTTYGTILINKSEDLLRRGDDAWVRYYERGRNEFDAAIQRERGNRITAFAYLESTIGVLTAAKAGVASARLDPADGGISRVVADWQGSYASVRVTLSPEQGFESLSRAERLSERFSGLGFVGSNG